MGNLYTIGGVIKQPPQDAFDIEGAVLECKANQTKGGKSNHLVKVKDDTGEIVLAFWDDKNLPPAGAIAKLINCTAKEYNGKFYYNGKDWVAKSVNTALAILPPPQDYTLRDLIDVMKSCLKEIPPLDADGKNTGPAQDVFKQATRFGLKVPKDVPY